MLKRMISPVLITVICAFCCASAVAEGSESEILFRNIPWGSSVSEVQELLKAELGEEITLRKMEPLHYMDRLELDCYPRRKNRCRKPCGCTGWWFRRRRDGGFPRGDHAQRQRH